MTTGQHGQSAAAEEDSVRIEVREGVGIISLNRPRRHNAENDAAREALGRAFRQVRGDLAVRSVLLRGEGPSFCSGRDKTGSLQPNAAGSYISLIKTAQDIRREQLAIEKPILCAMQGHVIGAGAELALGCDMRIVAEDLKFSLPEVGFGIVADTGSSTRLTALVGPARAKWMLISGVPIGAEDALAWGLAEWRVPREALDQLAFELARILASRPAKAAACQKQLIDDVAFGSADEGLKREMLVQLELFDGPEYKALQAAR
jgi:2-(1,2-epoxy-1,2-dihydrophenyl)acetyl-CoA isomerase